MMNDSTTSFMEVLEAKLARIHMPTKLVEEYEMVDLVKTNVSPSASPAGRTSVPRRWPVEAIRTWSEYPVRVDHPGL